MAFPFPVVARPVSPTVRVRVLETLAFKSAPKEAVGAAKLPEPLQRVEDLPGIGAGGCAAGGRVSKHLAGQIISTPAPIVVRVHDLAARQLPGHGQTPLSRQTKSDMTGTHPPIEPVSFGRQRGGLEFNPG